MLCQMIEIPVPFTDLIPLPTAIDHLKPLASGNAVRWAIHKQVVKPLKIGCYTLFTSQQVETLKKYFEGRK